MMPGMAFELERQWHRDTAEVTARDETHYRAAVEARAAHRSASQRASRRGRRDRLVAAVQAWTGTRIVAR